MRLSPGVGGGVGRRLLPPSCLAVSRGTLRLALAWMTPRSTPGVLPEEHAPCSWRSAQGLSATPHQFWALHLRGTWERSPGTQTGEPVTSVTVTEVAGGGGNLATL